MEPRRFQHPNSPLIRQVGFVTPGSEALQGPKPSLTQVIPSPSVVIIPPSTKSADASAQPSAPIAVPLISSRLPTTREEPEIPAETPGTAAETADAATESVLSMSPSYVKTESVLADSPVNKTQPPPPLTPLQEPTVQAPPEVSTQLRSQAAAQAPSVASIQTSNAGKPGIQSKAANSPSSGPATPNSQAASNVGTTFNDKGGSGLSSKPSKAERRALQEAQRAAKAAAKESAAAGGKPVPVPKDAKSGSSKGAPGASSISVKGSVATEKRSQAPGVAPEKKGQVPSVVGDKKKDSGAGVQSQPQGGDDSKAAKGKKKAGLTAEVAGGKGRVELFRHLPIWSDSSLLQNLESKFFSQEGTMAIHPAIYEVGLQFLRGNIVGGNARTIAMLQALKEMIAEYSTPPEKTLDRDLMARISPQVAFLKSCRPLGVGMGTAIRILKQIISHCDKVVESEAKAMILLEIDRFIQEKIVLADHDIVKQAVQKIRAQGDVLLTYGSSFVVESVFKRAHDLGRRFQVVVVDSRPKLEGKNLLRRLLNYGISCTYSRLNSVSYIMNEVTRVFLGASSISANGFVQSRIGSATVGMVAHNMRVPVMVCCETYKFHEKVQLDSIATNELGDPDDLVVVPGREDRTDLQNWSGEENLQLLHLKYDSMPPEYVTMIICELGMVPPTSVPVILRENRKNPILL